MSGNKKENAVPNETKDEMEPRRSGKSAAQKARNLHRSAGTLAPDHRASTRQPDTVPEEAILAQTKDEAINLKAREHS